MHIPSRFRSTLAIASIAALSIYFLPAHAADKPSSDANLQARIKALEEKVALLEETLKQVGLSPVTAEEQEKYKKYMDSLSTGERGYAELELAHMSPAERLTAIHRIAAMTPVEMKVSKKQEEANRVLEDLRLLDSATDQYALETNRTSGMHPTFADLKNYLKSGTQLYNTGADIFGHAYGPFTVDSIPMVNPETFNALSDVAEPSFWSPFR